MNNFQWIKKAQERLQNHANNLFYKWSKTTQGERWKNRKRKISPYQAGFSLPDYHHDLIEAVGSENEETAKAIMLSHYI